MKNKMCMYIYFKFYRQKTLKRDNENLEMSQMKMGV
jgi:hypothetical protein